MLGTDACRSTRTTSVRHTLTVNPRPHHRDLMRAVQWLLPWMLLLAACAGPTGSVGPATGPLSFNRQLLAAAPRTERPDEHVAWLEPGGPALGEATSEQRQSECRLAANQIERVLSAVDSVSAQVEHVYWLDHGAFTLSSWRRLAEGGRRGDSVDGDRLARTLAPRLCAAVGNQRGWVHLVHARTQSGWELASISVESSVVQLPPPEAKTLPVDAPDLPAGAFAALEEAARRWRSLLRAPRDGWARVEFRVDFEDYRYTGSSLMGFHAGGTQAPVDLPQQFETQLADALVGFAEGIGKRSVRLTLEAMPALGEREPRWKVLEVATLRPQGHASDDPFTTSTEYRLLHEEILRRWRQEVRDYTVLAAQFTAEQAAIWIVGGWATKGMGTLLELAEGPVLRVLGKGGPEAAGWLESVLTRLPKAERQALAKLWTKMETGGVEALSAAEKNELRAALRKLDELAATKLTETAKGKMWKLATERFWADLERRNPDLASKLFLTNGRPYPVHHRFPLEYAHIDPELDVNAVSELVAVEQEVHNAIGNIWTRFRSVNTVATPADIKAVMGIVDRRFGRWYNTVYTRTSEYAQLQAAEQAALAEVDTLIASIRSR